MLGITASPDNPHGRLSYRCPLSGPGTGIPRMEGGRMNGQQQRHVLAQLMIDIGQQAHCQVFAVPLNPKKDVFKLILGPSVCPSGQEPIKSVFGYAHIRPRVGCLSLTTWAEFFTPQQRAALPNWQLRQGSMWGQDGLRLRHCDEADRHMYAEAVRGLSIACGWCLGRGCH